MNWRHLPAAVAVIFLLTWLAKTSDSWATAFSYLGKKTDYYNLLVDGFLDGHLYMNAEVHPDLLHKDPAIRRGAPYLLDATLFQGRYYLYYGPVPAVLTFLPYSCLTGHDLAPNIVCLIFCIGGYLGSACTFFRARRDYFPKTGPGFDSVCLLLLATASLAPVLVIRAAHYEVPVAAAYTFISWFIYSVYRALHEKRSAVPWLALASLCGGLAVGCRPSLILLLPALAGAAYLLWRGRAPQASLKAYAIAITSPAAFIGLWLALYNYGRYGNPLDFGYNYGLNAFFETGKPFMDWSFLWPNAKWYYFTPPSAASYFPYFFPINAENTPPKYYGNEAVHGQWLITVLALLTLLAAWLCRRRLTPSWKVRTFEGLLLWMFASSFVFMIALCIRADRYMPDFQVPLIIGITFVAGKLCAALHGHQILSMTWRILFAATALSAAVFNFLIAIETFDIFRHTRPETYARLAYRGNDADYLAAKHGLFRYGPVKFRVTIPTVPRPVAEPLLISGLPNKVDVLYALVQPAGTFQLYLHHGGYGGPHSPTLQYSPGQTFEIEVDAGGFYPPLEHRYYDGWADRDKERRKLHARVTVDGIEVLRVRQKAHDAPRGWIHLGRSPALKDAAQFVTLSKIERLPAGTAEALASFSETGAWRLEVELPLEVRRLGQPILASGVTGAGNLLFLEILEEQKLRFGLDQWGAGLASSPELPLATPGKHIFEIFVGPQIIQQAWPADWNVTRERVGSAARLLNVWMDGVLVWSTPVTANANTYDFVNVGQNLQGFSSSPRDFSGILQKLPFKDEELRAFLLRNLPTAQ